MNCCDYACTQSPGCPAGRKLTERDLDRHRADMQMPPEPLPDAALAQMLRDGTLAGPYRRCHPLTLTWRQRLARWWQRHVIADEPRTVRALD